MMIGGQYRVCCLLAAAVILDGRSIHADEPQDGTTLPQPSAADMQRARRETVQEEARRARAVQREIQRRREILRRARAREARELRLIPLRLRQQRLAAREDAAQRIAVRMVQCREAARTVKTLRVIPARNPDWLNDPTLHDYGPDTRVDLLLATKTVRLQDPPADTSDQERQRLATTIALDEFCRSTNRYPSRVVVLGLRATVQRLFTWGPDGFVIWEPSSITVQLWREAGPSSEGIAGSPGRPEPQAGENPSVAPSRPLPPSAPPPPQSVPVPDQDGDGIGDEVDQCPRAAEDMNGHLDTDGCPDADGDADGVPDVIDQCPTRPEDYDAVRDEDGCPD
jgi:hypothetical protein